jgi:hypothetical protein
MGKKRLFYDIETSFCEGHFWRPGYNQTILPHQIIKYAQIISVSYKWEGGEVQHLDWGIDKQCDKQLVKKFIKILDKADEIVAHNGDRFDIKWIRTRALYHGIEMRDTYTMIDTLKMCKKYLALPSNKLSEVAKYFGCTLKLDAGGIDTWMRIVFNKDQKALDHMHTYCDGDVITLEEVYNKLRPFARNKSNYAVLKGGAKYACPECGSVHVGINKTYTTSAGTIQHFMKCREKECRQPFKINNKTYQDLLQYRMLSGCQ